MKPTPKEQAERIVAEAKQKAEDHGYDGACALSFAIGYLTNEIERLLTPKPRRAKP